MAQFSLTIEPMLSSVDVVKSICKNILKRIPFNMELQTTKFGDRFFESIFQNEMERFQKLFKLINESINNLMRTLQGSAIVDTHFDQIFREIENNGIPSIWRKRSYLTVKSLSNYIDDLSKRIPYFQKWAKSGAPNAIWFSAFYFPQAFVTAIKHGFAKRMGLEYGDVTVEVEVTDFESNDSDEFMAFMKVNFNFFFRIRSFRPVLFQCLFSHTFFREPKPRTKIR